MVKYNYIELGINNGELENVQNLRKSEQNILMNRNVVYIYKETTSQHIYIGQTKQFRIRNNQHFNSKVEFQQSSFDKVIIVGEDEIKSGKFKVKNMNTGEVEKMVL